MSVSRNREEAGGSEDSSDAGLTLIELVVAMAIFALIAMMGLQALTGAMRMRDRLEEIDTNTADLALALSLLRADLGAVVPLLFHEPGQPPRSAIDLDPSTGMLGLSLGGQLSLPERPGPGLQRVQWRLQSGQLSRRSWPTLYPARAEALSPEVVLLKGIQSWSLRSYWSKLGWQTGSSGELRSAPDPANGDSDTGPVLVESYSSALPEAVELTLETEQFGRIVLVENLK